MEAFAAFRRSGWNRTTIDSWNGMVQIPIVLAPESQADRKEKS